MNKTNNQNPKGNYPPGISDEDVDRAWGEEQEFLAEKEIEHQIDRAMELESLRKLDEYEVYGFPGEFDEFNKEEA